MSRLSTTSRWVAALLWLVPAAGAAQEPAPPSDEEMERLMEALGEDAQSGPTDAPAPPAAQGPLAAASSALSAMNPPMSFILDVAAAWFSDDEPLQTGAHDPSATGFHLQQLEWFVSADVDPWFRLQANVVFGEGGVELEEAFATTAALPANLQVRAGQFLTRFGRLNETHPHVWSFVDQPLVLGKLFGGEGSRGLGAEVSWLAPLPWFVELIASTTAPGEGGHAHEAEDGEAPEEEAEEGIHGLEDLVYTAALRQFFDLSPDWSLLWGLSAQIAPNPDGTDTQSAVYGTDLYLRFRPVDSPERTALSWQSEGLFRNRPAAGADLQDWGLYTQLVWSIDARWEVGGRYERVDGLAGDPLDADWTDARQRTSAQITFRPSHFSRLRLQGSWSDPSPRDPIWGAMLNLELIAGAHGAHAF